MSIGRCLPAEILALMIELLTFLAKRVFSIGGPHGYSVPLEDLFAELSGKRIAIVGNSRALEASDYGTSIDQAEIIIRINRAPMPTTLSHGSKTNWLALATRLPQSDFERIKAERILWMSPKRKRLSFRLAKSDGFYLFPLAGVESLRGILHAPPTTGLMIIDLVARSDATSISLYGFDFFASLSLTGSRTAKQVPHDFAAEQNWVSGLIDSDPRVKQYT